MGEPEQEHAPYNQPFESHSAHGSAVRLVTRTGASGVVLDLGCGYGPVAEPLRDAGLEYVGLDIDPGGLADLESRGFSVGRLDLNQPANEVEAILRRHLGDRPLGAVMALDALEHVSDPAACVDAITAVARDHPDARLVLSLPNVTHVDLAGKLLLGRWDITEIGLLDRTHVQFFDGRRAVALVTAAGWRAIDADDVETEITEQCDPADAPHLRPGAPLNELLRDLRGRADGHGETYQFVRAYALDAAPPGRPDAATKPDEPFAVVVVEEGADLDDAAADLAAQVDRSFSVVVVATAPATVPDDLASRIGIPDEQLRVVVGDGLHGAIVETPGRYVFALGPGERVTPDWLRASALGVDKAPGRLIVGRCTDPTGARMPVATFDLAGSGLAGRVPAAAYAVPRAAVVAGAIRYGGPLADRVAGLARTAMWSGRYDLAATTCSATDPADLGVIGDAVSHILDEHPIVLAPGAASPLAALQRELVAARNEVQRVNDEFHQFRHGHEVYVAASDADRAALNRRLARATTPWGALTLTARRAASIVRRRAARR